MAAKAIASINELAKLVDKSAPAVQKWVRHPQWPFGAAPWPASSLPKIKVWAEATLQEDRASGEPAAELSPEVLKQRANLTDAKAKKTLVETRLKLIDLKEREREVHDVATCRQRQVEKITLVKNALTTQLPRDIVRAIRLRDRALGREAVENDATEVVRREIELALMQHLASGPTVEA